MLKIYRPWLSTTHLPKQPRYHHWKAHTDAIQQLTFGALDYSWNILLGHGAAHDGVVEFETCNVGAGRAVNIRLQAFNFRFWARVTFHSVCCICFFCVSEDFWFGARLEVTVSDSCLKYILQKRTWFGRVVTYRSRNLAKPIREIEYDLKLLQVPGPPRWLATCDC